MSTVDDDMGEMERDLQIDDRTVELLLAGRVTGRLELADVECFVRSVAKLAQGPAPLPSADLLELFGGVPARDAAAAVVPQPETEPARWLHQAPHRRRIRRPLAVTGLICALTGSFVGAAAADVLPAPAQRQVAAMVERFSPFRLGVRTTEPTRPEPGPTVAPAVTSSSSTVVPTHAVTADHPNDARPASPTDLPGVGSTVTPLDEPPTPLVPEPSTHPPAAAEPPDAAAGVTLPSPTTPVTIGHGTASPAASVPHPSGPNVSTSSGRRARPATSTSGPHARATRATPATPATRSTPVVPATPAVPPQAGAGHSSDHQQPDSNKPDDKHDNNKPDDKHDNNKPDNGQPEQGRPHDSPGGDGDVPPPGAEPLSADPGPHREPGPPADHSPPGRSRK